MSNNITLFLLVLTKMSILSSVYMQESDTRVVRTWRSGGQTSNIILFTIPIELARQYELNEPTNVLMMTTDKGILIRKLEVPTK